MSTIFEKTKEHIGAITTLISTVGIIIGGFIFIDERYAHAGELKEQLSQIQQIRKDNAVQYRRMKIDSIDDKIFFLEIKRDMSPEEAALLGRYKRQREDEQRMLREEMRQR